jgi:hypothetical protein
MQQPAHTEEVVPGGGEKEAEAHAERGHKEPAHSDELALPKKTHPNVAPQLGGVGCSHCCNSVLDESHIKLVVVLNDGPSGQDGLRVLWVVRQCIAQVLKCAQVVPHSEIQQAHSCQQLYGKGEEQESLHMGRKESVEKLVPPRTSILW